MVKSGIVETTRHVERQRPVSSLSLNAGWYADPYDRLCYVHSVASDVDTGERMAIFILYTGLHACKTSVQRLDSFVEFLNRELYRYADQKSIKLKRRSGGSISFKRM